jgi:hypothetical protein
MSACFKSARNKTRIPSEENSVLTEVTVIDQRGLDGCGFILKLTNQTFLIPINLNDSFKINNHKIRIAYKVQSGASTCMAGPLVMITYAEQIQ